jgi:hypothetical protein
MNKRLEKEFGEQVEEQRGWHWALTVLQLKLGAKTREEMT